MPSGLLGNGTANGVIDVKSFMDSDVPGLIAAIVGMGVLVSVGTTRDRGAISLTVTYDGQWDREYFRRSDEACDWLSGAAKTLRAMGLSSAPEDPPPVQTPTRRRSKLS